MGTAKLTAKDIAERFGTSVSSVHRWKDNGHMPEPAGRLPGEKTVFWRREDIDAWVACSGTAGISLADWREAMQMVDFALTMCRLILSADYRERFGAAARRRSPKLARLITIYSKREACEPAHAYLTVMRDILQDVWFPFPDRVKLAQHLIGQQWEIDGLHPDDAQVAGMEKSTAMWRATFDEVKPDPAATLHPLQQIEITRRLLDCAAGIQTLDDRLCVAQAAMELEITRPPSSVELARAMTNVRKIEKRIAENLRTQAPQN